MPTSTLTTTAVTTTPKVLLGSLLFLFQMSFASATPAQLFRREDLVVDDGPAPPTRSFLILRPEPSETEIVVVTPTVNEEKDIDGLLSEQTGMGSDSSGWNSKHTLIIALVISLSSLFFIVLMLYIYSLRRKERLRRENATRKGRAMMASTTESAVMGRPGWGWARRFAGRDNSQTRDGASRPGTTESGLIGGKMRWGRGAFWEGDAGIAKPGRTAK